MFAEFLRKDSYEMEFSRLGIRTAINPLSEDELEECRRMKGTDGARYALYLACPALHEEGERLYKNGEIFSPLDITMAVDIADINAAYGYIREISGMGESQVKLYKHSFGADETFDEISRGLADNAEKGEIMSDDEIFYDETDDFAVAEREGRKMMNDVGFTNNLSNNVENGGNMEGFVTILAQKLRMAAENM